MKRVMALGATLALLLAPVLVRLLKAQSPPQGSAATFAFSPPSLAYVGSVFNFSVTAFDSSNHAASSYTGTVHFTSTDPLAVLPPDYTFTTGDSGTHMFSGTLNTLGTQTIAATDTANGALTGTSNSITVSATPPLPPPTFALTDLGPLAITAAPSGATALNAAGQVTGFGFENFPSPVCFASGANRAFLWLPQPAYGLSAGMNDLGTLGGASSFGYGINNAGQIVGGADICVNGGFSTQRAFIWQNGTMTALDPSTDPNGYSSAFAINTNADVAGYINNLNNSGIYQPVIWKGGTAAGLTVLAPLGCPFTPNCQGKAFAINDAGQAAGWNYGAFVRGYQHAVMWDSNGQPTDLGSFGRFFNDQANAINSKGDVVGYSQLDPDIYYSIGRAVLWQNGNPQNPQDLGTIPGFDPIFGSSANITDNSSSAWGINSKGEIVGISADGSGAVIQGNGGRAFLYIPTPAPGAGGQMYDLLSLLTPGTNWRQLQAAWAINDNGQILGVGFDSNQQQHGFLLTPMITATTTALTTSATPSVFGQSVSFSATVMPAPPNANAVNDTVTFYDGNTNLGSGTYNGNGVWILNTALPSGGRSITASYSGDYNFGASTSAALTQTVNQAATTAALVSVSPNPANFGQTVTLTAQVTVVAPGLGTPTGPSGTVTFYDNATALNCSSGNQSLSGSQATCQYAFTSPGSHSLTASYAGDTNFMASATSAVTLTVAPPPATHFAVAGPLTATAGSSFNFTLTALDQFNNAAKTYTGTVQFSSTDGQAALPGFYTFTAADNGTHTFGATLNTIGSQTVIATDVASATITGTSNSIIVNAAAPPPLVQIVDNEAISVTDSASFPDVFDPEAVHVSDAAFVTPLIQVSAPVAEFSAGTLGFSGQSGSQTITVSDIGTASLTLTSVTFSGSPQFAVTQIACSNLATSFSTMLPSGGVCAVTIGYSASPTPANDNATLVFADNAALSNVTTVPAGSSYTQSIPLNGSGTTTAPPPPPPAVVPLADNETVTVTDSESFPDVSNPENIKVTDAVWITPLIQVSAPVAEFSVGSLGFNGQGGSQTVTVSDIGTGSLALTSAIISGSSQFAITQIACSTMATSFSTVLPSGGACVLTIGYSASATPANDNGTLVFTDNAAVSNATSVPTGSRYTQSIPLSGGGITTAPPPPPPAVVTIPPILETINVTDSASFPDVLDSETVTVSDQVTVKIVSIPTSISISISPLTVTYGTAVSATVSVTSSAGTVTGNAFLTVDGGTTAGLPLSNGSAVFANVGVLTAGKHNLTAIFTAQGAFSASTTSTTITVSQAVPLITWPVPAPITYGAVLSPTQLDATANVPGTFTYSPAAGAVLSAGAQTLSARFNPTDSTDYTPATASVTLLVNQATPAITWANPPAITYGTALSGKQLNATASVPGTFTYSPASGTVLTAGSQTLSVVFTPTDVTDYTRTKAAVTLQVNKAAPLITWPNPASITLGTPLSSAQLNAMASVPGTFVYNPPAKTVLGAGTQTLSVTFTPADTTDYQAVTQSASITVNVNGSLTVQSGQSYTFNNGSISGNVTLGGGTLTLVGSTVGGNLTMSSGTLNLGGNSTVSNNVQIQGGSFSIGPANIKGNLQITNVPAGKVPGVVCGANVSGDLQFQYNAILGQIGPSACSGNRIGGNLMISNNTAPLQIFNNAVGGNLQVQSNAGSAQVFQNTIQNALQCSGNSSPFTGGKNTAASKQGQCASF